MPPRLVRSTSSQDLAHDRIRSTLDVIPAGCVATYGQVATEAGLPGRARLVGRLLRDLPANSPLPWHRVVNAAGTSSLDPGSRSGKLQLARLRKEGVVMSERGRVDLARYRWQPR